MSTPTLTASMTAALAELNMDANTLLSVFMTNPGSLFAPSAALTVAETKLATDLIFDLTHVDSKGNVAASGVDLITVSANHFASYGKAGLVVATLGAENNLGTESATYTIVGGADKAGFAIVNGQLVTTRAFDWHAQSVADVQIQAKDAAGHTFIEDFKFTLDHNAPPVTDHPLTETLSATHVAEYAAAGTVVGKLGATDSGAGETFTYAVTGGDVKDFAVVNGNLVTTGPISHATSPTEQVTVTVTDHAGATLAQSFTITTDQVYFAPTAVNLALTTPLVNEGAPAGLSVGTLSATDAKTASSDTFSYSIVGGANASDFAVSGNHLVTAAPLNGAGPTEEVTVKVTDSVGLSYNQTFEVAVNHVPGAVTLSSSTVTEGASGPVIVGSLSATAGTAGSKLVYSIDGGHDAASFAVDAAGHLVATAPFLQTTQHTADVVVRATDSLGAWHDTDLTVQVAAAPITGVTLSNSTVNEHLAGAVVGTLGAADVNQNHSFSYSLVGGDTTDFAVQTGHLVTTGALSFVQAASHSVTVQATDELGHSFQQSFNVGVNEVYVAPTDIAVTAGHIADGTAPGTTVATLAAVGLEPGDSATYAVVGGSAAADFAVHGSMLYATQPIGYAQTGGSVSVMVQATEANGLTFTKEVDLTVDHPTAPSPNGLHDIFLSSYTALADQPAGEIVGQLSSDDNQSVTWYIVGGANASEFALDSHNNIVTTGMLSTFSSLSADVIVAGQDATGAVFSQDFNLTVQPVSDHVGSGPVTASGGIYADIFQPQGGVMDITGFAEGNNDQINLSSYLSPAQVDTSHVRMTGTNDSHIEVDVNNGSGWQAVALLENAQSNDYTLSGGFGNAVSQAQLDTLTAEWISSHVVHA